MKISDIFMPSNIRCVFCGKEIGGEMSICADCYATLPFITGRSCNKCGGRVILEDVCIDCSREEHRFTKCFSICDYDDKMRGIILAFKQGGKKYIGEALAKVVYDKYLQLGVDFDIIIPMPIHPSREKERGFNQSIVLCKELMERTSLVNVAIVTKVKDTPHQTGLSRENRKTNLIGAFEVVDKTAIKGKRILVVDDIYTTGSTMSVLSDVLLKAGAESVYGLCLARGKVFDI
ncbi:MAG: ComF family protein [Clostridiales bacterium]|nr:ComF family protein [Clostridiales bacterium]